MVSLMRKLCTLIWKLSPYVHTSRRYRLYNKGVKSYLVTLDDWPRESAPRKHGLAREAIQVDRRVDDSEVSNRSNNSALC